MVRLLKIIFSIFFIFCLFIYINLKISDYNATVCYNNIENVKVGDNVDEGIKVITQKLIFGKKIIEKNHYNIKDSTSYMIIFPYKDRHDPASIFPIIYFDSLSRKITKIRTGIIS